MPLRTTAQAGPFTSTSSWSGGVAPVSGDTLAVNHAIDWTPAAGSSFTLGTGTGTAVTFGTGGKLTLTPAGAFTLTLAGATAGGNITSPEFVASSPNGLLTINIDGTANATGFAMVMGGNYSVTNGGGWSLTGGSDANRIELVSLPSDGSKNSWFTNGGTGGGGLPAMANVNVRRIGTATTDAFAPTLDNRQRTMTWTNVLLDSCGEVSLSGDANYTGTINWTNVRSINTLTNGTSTHPLFATFGATGPRTFTRCVWDKSLKFIHMRGCTFASSYLHNGWVGTDVTSVWTLMDGCFVRQTFDTLITSGSVTNSFLFWDNPSGANPHWLGGTTNPTGTVTFDWSSNIAEYNGNDASGNVYTLPATTNAALRYTIRNNIVLRNGAGLNSGALVTSSGTVAAGFNLIYERNTVFVAGQHGMEIAHLYPVSVESPNRYLSVRNNLFIGNGTGYKALNVDNSTLLDVMPPAVVDYNGSWQIQTTSGNANFTGEGRGYASRFSVTPGANDVDGQNPNFVDINVSLANWAVTQGSTAPTTAGKQADALAYIQADPTKIANLTSYIRAGLTPTNPAYKGTASDGGDIGAVPVQTVPPISVQPMFGASLFHQVY